MSDRETEQWAMRKIADLQRDRAALLVALERIVSAARQEFDSTGTWSGVSNDDLDNAYTAIRAARGESV